MTKWHDRLNQIVQGTLQKPTIVEIMRLPGVLEWTTGRVYTEWAIDKDFFSIGGSLFGGYVCALADQVACHTAITILEDDELIRTLNLSTTFFKRIDAGKLCVEGRLISASKTIIAVEVNFRSETGTPIAKAEAILYRLAGSR